MRALTFLALFALASPADAFVGDVQLRVTQGAGSDFTVQYKSVARQTDYWCAAGRYVISTLRLSDRTRIYRVSPPPRRQGQGITFSLDAARSSGETGITTFGGPQDGSMSASGAVGQFCRIYDDDF